MSEEIQKLVQARRIAAAPDDFCGPPDLRAAPWGLALSGGGIRSSHAVHKHRWLAGVGVPSLVLVKGHEDAP